MAQPSQPPSSSSESIIDTTAASSSSKKSSDFISDPGSVNGNFEITISGSKALLQIPGSGFAKVTVMDMQGRIVKPSAMVKTGSVEISLAEINHGKYIVSVEQKSVRWVRPIAIK